MDKIKKTEEEWRSELSPEEYQICRLGGTERAFTGKLNAEKRDGLYHCRGCGLELFSAETKFDSGSGWPSFFSGIAEDRIATHRDSSHGMIRTEITCARCNSHLGHVFEDGPAPTGLRYCVNSASLAFEPKS